MVMVVPVSPVDRSSDRPAYKQVADRLREELDGGDLRPGDRLPSETELMKRFSVSRATARSGLGVLIKEGRAESVQGRGVFVSEHNALPRLVIKDPVETLASGNASGRRPSMKTQAEQQGFAHVQQVTACEEVPADTPVATALDIPVGTTVFVRRRLVLLGRPGRGQLERAKLGDSYYPLGLVTDEMREMREATGRHGVHGSIARAGHEPTRYEESVLFRMPTPHEARQLRLPAGIPIIEQTRTAIAGDRRVECFIAISAGDKYELEYRIKPQ